MPAALRLYRGVDVTPFERHDWHAPSVIIAYHRTHKINNVYNIAYDKFIPKRSSLYGPGFYATYDLASQAGPRMRLYYGNYILRLAIDLSNYLVFDAPLQKELNLPAVSQQMRDHKIKLRCGLNTINNLFYTSMDAEATRSSSRANELYKATNNLPEYVAGMVFTGEQDGKVIVAYDLSTVRVLDYARWDDDKLIGKLRWRHLRGAFTRDNLGRNFVDRIIQQLMRMPLAKARRRFIRRVGEMSRRERYFMFYSLFTRKFNPDKSPFIKWLVSARSDRTFKILFDKIIGKPPDVAYARKHLRLRDTPVMHLAALPKNKFGNLIHEKMQRLLLADFMAEWQPAVRRQLMTTELETNKRFAALHLVANYCQGLVCLGARHMRDDIIALTRHWLEKNPHILKITELKRQQHFLALKFMIDAEFNLKPG